MSELQIHIPNSYLPERKYALHLLFDVLLNVPHDIILHDVTFKTQFAYKDHTWQFSDEFFNEEMPPSNLFSRANLPIPKIGSGPLKDLTILYGENTFEQKEKLTLVGIDVLASIFFMASRWEETLGPFDQHNRFLGASSIAHQFGFLKRPIVHEYATWLRNEFNTKGIEVKPQRNFKKVMTCDVDFPFYWDQNPIKKQIGAFLKKGFKAGRQAVKSYQASLKSHSLDPYYTFDKLMDDAENINCPIQFNFLAGGDTPFDGMYSLQDARIQKLLSRIIDRGHEIGLHGSYSSYNNLQKLKEEKLALERVLDQPIETNRQHFLRFEIPPTWRILDQIGILSDSSLGYPDQPGFRCGICIPFPVFDLENRNRLTLKEQPLILMDATLNHYLNVDAQAGIQILSELEQEIRQHRGEFVFLWHNSSFSYNGYEELYPVYQQFLKNE